MRKEDESPVCPYRPVIRSIERVWQYLKGQIRSGH